MGRHKDHKVLLPLEHQSSGIPRASQSKRGSKPPLYPEVGGPATKMSGARLVNHFRHVFRQKFDLTSEFVLALIRLVFGFPIL